ncbi:unnamed protein product [Psylliodes chrysocephalus]|uniref:Dendritic cell-specific transmembrane protein-like domain-containing protein n=1 Tax=Psylliodes chrysocephalus TaxID=3402493 RepID=A0A9P0CWG1_9CUCU|nr:unnamed protein product [Psylliodes chrysocephala]
MAFVRLIAIAHNLNNHRNTLVKEKEESIQYQQTGKKKFKFQWIAVKFRAKCKRFKRRIFYCWCCKTFCFNLQHSGSVENYVLKSLLGFLGGLILTYIFFMIFVFQLNVKISIATVICAMLGCVLVNGLAFSSKIRCIVFLTLPHFFSKKGRELLVAYAISLVLSGPAQNILNNLGILSESLACGQEQLKSVLRQIFEVIKKPFYAIKDAIKKVIATVKVVIKKIKEILIKIKRIIMAIVRVIKAAFMFLAKIINICNKELGTPFERCGRVFDNAIADCNAKLGAMFSWMCSITYIIKSVCYIVKIFDFVCLIVDFISNSIIGVVMRKIKGFIRHIRTMFYVRIKFSHSFHYESKADKSISEIAKDIQNEVKQRIKAATAIFQLAFVAAGMFIILLVCKVLIYRYRFLTNDGFDNKYVTEDFFQLDMRRAKHNRETVLPLNKKEEKLYVKLKSTKLTDVESKQLRKAIMNLLTVTIKAAIFMAYDYALCWIMEMIKYYGRFQSKVQAPNIPLPHISGKGMLADLLGSIVKAFQPMGLTLEIDTVPCLPTPIPPDYDRYLQILTLLILCWVMTILEPYGLRFRIYILTYYHPVRGKQRAIWLYNKILRKRTSFLKFARRQLRRKFFGGKDIEKVTCKEFLSAHFGIFAFCLDQSQTACLLCGKVFRETDSEKPIRCATPGCAGTYCDECFADLRNLCTVCLAPIEYGDYSDLSEEKDSSEEDLPKLSKKKKRKCPWKDFLSKYCKKKSRKRLSDEEIPLVPIPRTSKRTLIEVTGEEKDVDEIENDEESIIKEPKYETEDEDIEVLDEGIESGGIDDLGNASSASTDYSFSYQYNKLESSPDIPETSRKDVEKQEIRDYASMENFRYAEVDDNDALIIYEKAKHTDENLFKKEESSQTPTDRKHSKQNSTVVRCPYHPEVGLTDGKQSKQTSTISLIECPCQLEDEKKIDTGTVISGENLKSERESKHIDFVGLSGLESEKFKRKAKRKRKKTTVLCSCSDSNEEGIEFWEKTSMVAVPKKSTTSTNTRKDKRDRWQGSYKCKKPSSYKSSIAEEENTSNSEEYSSSSELRSLLDAKVKSDDNKKDTEMRGETSGTSGRKEEKEKKVKTDKPSKFIMFFKRVIPKYKIQHEK